MHMLLVYARQNPNKITNMYVLRGLNLDTRVAFQSDNIGF